MIIREMRLSFLGLGVGVSRWTVLVRGSDGLNLWRSDIILEHTGATEKVSGSSI